MPLSDKFQFEFQHILVGRRVGEWRRAVGGANLIECFRQDGDPDRESGGRRTFPAIELSQFFPNE